TCCVSGRRLARLSRLFRELAKDAGQALLPLLALQRPCRGQGGSFMTPISTADIERLRRRIERIEGGRMEPTPAPREPSFEDFTYSELFAQPRVDHYDVE